MEFVLIVVMEYNKLDLHHRIALKVFLSFQLKSASYVLFRLALLRTTQYPALSA